MNKKITNNIDSIFKKIEQQAALTPRSNTVFFKTGPGGYAEQDVFVGVSVPYLRTLAKEYKDLVLDDIRLLLEAKINEIRLLGLIILAEQFKKAPVSARDTLYEFYIQNLEYVNNWNLVDSSAHLIMGAHLMDKDRGTLLEFAQSNILWERRISIVATWYFIQKNDLDWTFKIAAVLLKDSHDLIHKAVGWMLREAGKRNQAELMNFLDLYAPIMPRTMLRYAIEKFSPEKRKAYLLKK